MKQWMKSKTATQNARTLLWCGALVVFIRLCFEFINQAFIRLTAGSVPKITDSYQGLYRWAGWDGNWYLGIIEKGYGGVTAQAQEVAFFPVFPKAVDAMSFNGLLPPLYVGLLLNLVISILIAFFIYKITCHYAPKSSTEDTKWKLGTVAVLVFFSYQASFFLFAFYTDAILVLSVVASFYFFIQKRYVWAAVFTFIAALTKSIGLMAVLPMILITVNDFGYSPAAYWRARKDVTRRVLPVVSGLAGLFTYIGYLWLRFGEPLKFISVQKLWERNIEGNFAVRLWEVYYRNVLDISYFGRLYNYLVEVFMMMVPIALIVLTAALAIKRKRLAWLFVTCFLTVSVPLSTGTTLSINRYVLTILSLLIPIMVGVFFRSSDRRWIVATSLIVSAMFIFQMYSMLGFLNGNYFAG